MGSIVILHSVARLARLLASGALHGGCAPAPVIHIHCDLRGLNRTSIVMEDFVPSQGTAAVVLAAAGRPCEEVFFFEAQNRYVGISSLPHARRA